MLCDQCVKSIKDEAKNMFLINKPSASIIGAAYTKVPNQSCVLIEYTDSNGGHRMDYQPVDNVLLYCSRCSSEL